MGPAKATAVPCDNGAALRSPRVWPVRCARRWGRVRTGASDCRPGFRSSLVAGRRPGSFGSEIHKSGPGVPFH